MNFSDARQEMRAMLKRLRAFEEVDNVLKVALEAEAAVVNAGIELERLNADIEGLLDKKVEVGEELLDVEVRFESEMAMMRDQASMLRGKLAQELVALERELEERRRAVIQLETDQMVLIKRHKERLDSLVVACDKEEARLEAAKRDYENFKKRL